MLKVLDVDSIFDGFCSFDTESIYEGSCSLGRKTCATSSHTTCIAPCAKMSIRKGVGMHLL